MLKPLREALQHGLQRGVFHHIDPVTDAEFIQGVVWASTNRQWRTGDCDRAEVREDALRFCLRALGVAAEAIYQISSND
jgi:hypothetical protein